jgi:hypothetical protein
MPVKYGRAKRAAGKPTPGTFRCRSGTWKSRPLESKLAPYGASPEFQALLLLESELISYKGLYVRADNPHVSERSKIVTYAEITTLRFTAIQMLSYHMLQSCSQGGLPAHTCYPLIGTSYFPLVMLM